MEDEVASLRSALSDRYEVQQEIGRGGMSVVYLARDVKHDRLVAVKVLRSDLSEQIGAERFHREVDIAAHLSNPHILPLFDSGESENRLYYVMPYVDGGTLAERIDLNGRLSADAAIEVARSVGLALAAAHEKGIVHRDIKPGNILFSGGEAVVADFGIARATQVEGAERLTRSGLSVGSPAFMSPEQAGGDPVDGRSDLYSLGCVLYTMLTGRPPFLRDTAQATIAAQIAEPAPSVREVRPEVPKGVEEIILTALQKDPAARFQTASELVAALDHPELMPERARARRRRARVRATLTALAVILGVGAVGWLAWRAFVPEPLPAADANRIMVFPLMERGETRAGMGYDAALTIGNVLNHADPLTFVSGWDWLDAEERADGNLLTADVARRAALGRRARWYVTGTILGSEDSATVTLLLHDAVADTSAAREVAIGPPDFAGIADAGLDATTRLLPILLQPGRSVDRAVLEASRSSSPAAMLAWVQGEKSYRASRFDEALGHYRTALEADSTWAFAALKGAQAASWLDAEEGVAALELVERAVSGRDLLPPKYAALADGLRAYLVGEAGESVRSIEQALEHDPEWAEAWTALGETYYHLMPDWETPLPRAEEAFENSLLADSTFYVPLYHLAEMAIRKGAVADARRYLDRYHVSRPDSTLIESLEVALACVSKGPEFVDWEAIVASDWETVANAAQTLSVGGHQPACTEAALSALLDGDETSAGWRWGSGYILQSLWLAMGRDSEAAALVDSMIRAGEGGAYVLFPVDAIAGYRDFDERAAEAMEMLPSDIDELGIGALRFVGEWAALSNDIDGLEEATIAARRVAAASDDVKDAPLAAGLEAQLAAMRGDSVRALTLLEQNPPRGRRIDLAWDVDYALPRERMLLAELLFAEGEFERAASVAAGFEAQPAVYLLYLPESLDLRARAAEASGDVTGSQRIRQRLSELSRQPDG